MTLKPYLQLVRLPNVCTAAADSRAGWLVVRGSFDEPRRWAPLLAASMAIYAAGIALNDVFDAEIDRVERPGRPLPSGAISRRFAAVLGGVLLATGPGLAALSGSATSLGVAGLLAACVLAYDAGIKRTVVGPIVMGACRGLNVLLGASQAPGLGGPTAWLFAGSLALFVMGLTWVSRSEAETGRAGGAIAGMALQDLAILGLVGVVLGVAGEMPRGPSGRPIVPLEGLAAIVLVALLVNLADGRAIREPTPATLQRAVKLGVLSLVWLDFGVVAALRGPSLAMAIAALWVPAFLLGRWLYST